MSVSLTASPAWRCASGSGATCSACSFASNARTAGNSPRRSATPIPGRAAPLAVARWDADGVRDDLRDYVLRASRGRSERRVDRRRDWLPQEGQQVLRRRAAIHRALQAIPSTLPGRASSSPTRRSAAPAFIDRALYLPRDWTSDRERRSRGGHPDGDSLRDKIALAERMLARAFDADAPARWVVADSGYGRSHRFRQWLERRGRAYAVMVPKTTPSTIAVGASGWSNWGRG